MTRVIKIGGRAQRNPATAALLAEAWRREPESLCVVHGGGDDFSALQRALGAKPRFSGGRRVTGARDLDIARMALSGTANKRLVSALVSQGIEAIGISGEDAALIVARRHDDASLGYVGVPERVNVRLLRHLLDGGFLPVISPLAREAKRPGTLDSATLNVNGDDAAAAIAAALVADELLLISDVPGVTVNDAIASTLEAGEIQALIASGDASGGMIAKLEAAIAALRHGVESVRIGDVNALSDTACGTRISLAGSLV
ncbi:MAG: acetylglutamate kinase [Gemmatimonadaceae bacterium]